MFIDFSAVERYRRDAALVAELQRSLDARSLRILPGDMLETICALPDNSVDSVVTDPPYHLTSVVKRFGGDNAAPAQYGTDGAFARQSKGFMSKVWDGGDIAFRPETWAEVLRVMKPGAHLVAFGASRGYHRMACAIEDAGFEIRDSLMWIYGVGFPKGRNIYELDILPDVEAQLRAQGVEGAIEWK